MVHPKGNGVIVHPNLKEGIKRGTYVNSYVGELYPPWLWERKEAEAEEKRRQKMKENGGKIILPEFWNIRLELPRNPICKGGYDILYVDASRKGNFCSRTSHSCTPNLASSVAVVNGRYTIALRALRDIMPGEELTQDYNCVTDSLEEFKAAVCLCGFPRCRGAFLYCTADKAYRGVLDRHHTTLHRMAMIVEAASDEYDDTENSKKQNASEYVNVPIEQKHLNRIVRHGLGKNSLGGFPSWMVRYASICIRFAEFERKKLPQHLRKQIMKRKTQLMENAKKHGVNVAAAQEAAARAAVEEAVSGSSMALNQEQHAKKLNQEIEVGEELVGRPVKLYWPTDQTWYDGYVEKYDAETQKHTVRYRDGEAEKLLLANERIEYLPWPTFQNSKGCVVCRKDVNHDKMLICDECDKEYHMYCLTPKLTKVPEGHWYCPRCTAGKKKKKKLKRGRKKSSNSNENTAKDEPKKELIAKNGIVINKSTQDEHNIKPSTTDKDGPQVDKQPWDEVQAQGVLEQRLTNLVITLNKVEHKLRSRIDQMSINEDYWVGDIVESRWPGVDANELYPDWYEVKVLHVYEDNTCNVEFFHDEGNPNAIVPFSKIRRIKKKDSNKNTDLIDQKETMNLPAPIRRVGESEAIEIIWSGEKSIIKRIATTFNIENSYISKIQVWYKAFNNNGFPFW